MLFLPSWGRKKRIWLTESFFVLQHLILNNSNNLLRSFELLSKKKKMAFPRASQMDFENLLKRKESNKILLDLTTHFFT